MQYVWQKNVKTFLQFAHFYVLLQAFLVKFEQNKRNDKHFLAPSKPKKALKFEFFKMITLYGQNIKLYIFSPNNLKNY
jgi:hypothetical protein